MTGEGGRRTDLEKQFGGDVEAAAEAGAKLETRRQKLEMSK